MAMKVVYKWGVDPSLFPVLKIQVQTSCSWLVNQPLPPNVPPGLMISAYDNPIGFPEEALATNTHGGNDIFPA